MLKQINAPQSKKLQLTLNIQLFISAISAYGNYGIDTFRKRLWLQLKQSSNCWILVLPLNVDPVPKMCGAKSFNISGISGWFFRCGGPSCNNKLGGGEKAQQRA